MKGLVRLGAGYAVTGGVAAVVDIGGFHLLTRQMEGVAVPAALSFTAAAVVNYLLTSAWVFRRDWRSARRAGLFMVSALTGLAVNAGVTTAVASWLPVHATLAKVAGVGVAFGINFAMNARWVFRAPDHGACAGGPGAGGRTTHRATHAAASRPGPSAME